MYIFFQVVLYFCHYRVWTESSRIPYNVQESTLCIFYHIILHFASCNGMGNCKNELLTTNVYILPTTDHYFCLSSSKLVWWTPIFFFFFLSFLSFFFSFIYFQWNTSKLVYAREKLPFSSESTKHSKSVLAMMSLLSCLWFGIRSLSLGSICTAHQIPLVAASLVLFLLKVKTV